MFKKFELKLTAFACARPLLFSRTGLSNLLNQIQFTFEVVPCLILGLFRQFFSQVYINFGQALQEGGWAGGGEGWVGVGSGEGGGKSSQVKTRGHQSLLDDPDRSTRLKGHHSG